MECTCGFENIPGARFCGSCGRALASEAASASAPAAVSPATPPPLSGGDVPASTHRISRLGIVAVLAVAILAAAGYWWLHRPRELYKADNSGLYPIAVDGKHGFMDKSGKTVIAPQFDDTGSFSEGLAAVKVGTRFGFINSKGSIVIAPQFDEASAFSDGRAAVRVGTKFGFIDKKGGMAIVPQFDNVKDFRNGRAAVQLCCGPNWTIDTKIGGHVGNDRYGFIDRDGKYIGPPTFLFVDPSFLPSAGWTDDVTLVKTADDQAGILNDSGKVTIVDKVEEIGFLGFNEGLAAVASAGKWGYIDAKGTWAIEPQFEATHGFQGGLAAARVGGRWGYVDRQGRFVINPQYDRAGFFVDGCAPVGTDDKIGFIDKDGHTLGTLYQQTTGFSEGLAGVKTEEGWGFIDTKGKMVIAPQFDGANQFQNGLVHVTVLGKEAYVTPAGKFVVNPFPGRTVREEKERIAAAARAEEARLAAEASQAAQAAQEAEAANRLRVEQGIAGTWTGTFARNANATLTITSSGGAIGGVLLNDGWSETFRGEILPNNQLVLTGINAVRVSSSASGAYTLDTATLDLSPDGASLIGQFRDASGSSGPVAMQKGHS
jgi:hypothetical protein